MYLFYNLLAIGAPVATARELDDAVMQQSAIVVDSYAGAQTESGDIILSKVIDKYIKMITFCMGEVSDISRLCAHGKVSKRFQL